MIDPALARDLGRPLVAEWLDDAARAAIDDPAEDPSGAVLALGRLLRSGDLSAAARSAIAASLVGDAPIDEVAHYLAMRCLGMTEQWLVSLLDASDAHAELRTKLAARADVDTRPRDALAALVARDDAESALVLLAEVVLVREAASTARFEAEALAAAAPVDEVAGDLAAEIRAALGTSPPPAWLRRAARLGTRTWWLDCIATAGVRSVLRPTSDDARVLRVPHSPLGEPTLVTPLVDATWPVVARLFDADVEVLARGLSEDTSDADPGLFVRARDGAPGRIERVELSPAGPLDPELDLESGGWWVPLAAANDRARRLVVRYQRAPMAELELCAKTGEAPPAAEVEELVLDPTGHGGPRGREG